MEMQRVVVSEPGATRLERVAQPQPGPDDVVVQVAACGICGSDLSYIGMGGMPGTPGGVMPLGHELSGVVAATGENISGVQIGDRVVVNPLAADNNIGNGGSEGGFAPYLLVRNANRDRCLYRLPEGLSFEQGALVEPLGVAMHGVNQAEVGPGSKVVVFGAGPIGLGAIAVLRHRGVEDVLAVDMSPYRLQLAQKLGARAVFQADQGDVWEFIRREHGAESLYGMPVVGTDAFIDAAGVGEVVRGMFDHAKFGAHLVIVAMHKAEATLPIFQIMAKELIIKGSMAYPDEFDSVLELLTAGRVDVTPMISHRFALEQFDDALSTARQQNQSAKVMVTMAGFS